MNWAAMIAELGYVGMVLGLLAPFCRRWWPLLPVGVIGVTVISGLPEALRASFGDPGAATMVAGFWMVLRSAKGEVGKALREVGGFLRLVFLVALPLYLSSLSGIGPDIYALGFGAWWLAGLTGLAGCWATRSGHWPVVLWTGLGLLLTALDLGESSNLWDCLLDFPAAFAGLVFWVTLTLSRLRREKNECCFGLLS